MGKSITIRSVDPDNPNIVASTIIDCNSNENQRFRAFRFHSKENISSILAGLTITGCSSQYGGAILCQNCSPTIKNCNFIFSRQCKFPSRAPKYNPGPRPLRSLDEKDPLRRECRTMCSPRLRARKERLFQKLLIVAFFILKNGKIAIIISLN